MLKGQQAVFVKHSDVVEGQIGACRKTREPDMFSKESEEKLRQLGSQDCHVCISW